MLSSEGGALVIAFRRHTLLPLDDCLYALGHDPAPDPLVAASLPAAPRHQPIAGGLWRQTQALALQGLPHGYFQIELVEVHTVEGRLYLLGTIDPTIKFAFVELHEQATRRVTGDFLRHLIEAVPYEVHPDADVSAKGFTGWLVGPMWAGYDALN